MLLLICIVLGILVIACLVGLVIIKTPNLHPVQWECPIRIADVKRSKRVFSSKESYKCFFCNGLKIRGVCQLCGGLTVCSWCGGVIQSDGYSIKMEYKNVMNILQGRCHACYYPRLTTARDNNLTILNRQM